jgi:hypothetical protein
VSLQLDDYSLRQNAIVCAARNRDVINATVSMLSFRMTGD